MTEIERTPERQGRIAFHAYGLATSGRSAVTGDALPEWTALSEDVRRAWIHAAHAVRKDTLNPDWAQTHGYNDQTAPWLRGPRAGENEERRQQRLAENRPTPPEVRPDGASQPYPGQMTCSICGWYVTPGWHSDASCHVNQTDTSGREVR